jgi:RNA polymerase sigma-70 factor (ECF subfamily)
MWMRDEDKLVEDVIRGNHSSFEVLLRPYRQGLLNVAYRITGDREEAMEVCQDTLLKIFRYLRSYKKGRPFKTWAYKILVNTSYDSLKRRKKYEQVITSQKNAYVLENPQPEQKILVDEIKERIHSVLTILSPKERAVFLLRDSEGLSVQEASLVLRCSPMSVRTHLSRARRKIKAHFEKRYPRKDGEVQT